jgi:hypothetical protein
MTMEKTKYRGIYFRLMQDGRKVYFLRIKSHGRQTWRATRGPGSGTPRNSGRARSDREA